MKKFLVLFLLVFCLVSVTACKDKVAEIKIVENSVPEIIYSENLDNELGKIQIEVTTSKGKSSVVNLEKSMISSDDYAKLTAHGSYDVKVNYEGASANVYLTVIPQTAYTVNVVYPNGEPVNSGVSVQWCTDTTCKLPAYVNQYGLAYSEIEDDNYFIHIEGIPTGYTYDPNAYTASPTSKNVKIKLISLIELTGEGSESNPYVTNVGAFTVTYQAKVSEYQYFTFTPTEDGVYSIKSLAVDKLATNTIDPYIGFLGTSDDMSKIDVSGNNSLQLNFNHTFTATANTTYKFIVFVSDATRFPASFNIQITK